MKNLFVSFPEAQWFLPTPNGAVPYYKDPKIKAAIMKVKLSEDEFRKLGGKEGEFYIVVPMESDLVPPVTPIVLLDSPFAKPSMQVHGKEDE